MTHNFGVLSPCSDFVVKSTLRVNLRSTMIRYKRVYNCKVITLLLAEIKLHILFVSYVCPSGHYISGGHMHRSKCGVSYGLTVQNGQILKN